MLGKRVRLVDSLDELASAENLHEVAESAMRVFREVIHGDYYSVCSCMADFHQLEIFHPDEGWLAEDAPLLRSFQDLQNLEPDFPSHPTTLAFGQSRRPGGFIRSLLLSDRKWRNTLHYQVVDRGLGIRDMASIFLCAENGRLMILNCGRTHEFRAREMETLLHLEHVMTLILKGREAELLSKKEKLPEHPCNLLTRREMEILHWVREGKRNAEIAIILSLSHHTIRKHLENIFGKLGVETRAGAVNALSV